MEQGKTRQPGIIADELESVSHHLQSESCGSSEEADFFFSAVCTFLAQMQSKMKEEVR